MGLFSKVPTVEWKDIDKDAIILDIRNSADYDDFHAPNAQNIEINNIKSYNEDKDKPIYVTCYRGNSSKTAVKFLTENGYRAFSIKGGMSAYK